MDIITLLLQYINLPAALAGAAVTLGVMYMLPAADNAKWFEIKPGTWYGRLVPAIAPVVAVIVCIILEWNVPHAELNGKTGIVANDVVRGILSGWGSEFILRIYFKTVAGV
jgi:hypothetical protein